jgi:hypothetical protein
MNLGRRRLLRLLRQQLTPPSISSSSPSAALEAIASLGIASVFILTPFLRVRLVEFSLHVQWMPMYV